MRRTANLFEQICTLENLREAFRKASQGKRDQEVVREFVVDLDRRLSEMLVEIGNGSIALGDFTSSSFAILRKGSLLLRASKNEFCTMP